MNDIKPERNRCYDMDKIEIEPSKVCEACTEFANAWTKKDDSEWVRESNEGSSIELHWGESTCTYYLRFWS